MPYYDNTTPAQYFQKKAARRGGVEVAGWTVDRKTRVRFPHTLTACGPSDGKEVKDVFGRPGARVGVGSVCLRPLADHGVGCPAAGQNLENWTTVPSLYS